MYLFSLNVFVFLDCRSPFFSRGIPLQLHCDSRRRYHAASSHWFAAVDHGSFPIVHIFHPNYHFNHRPNHHPKHIMRFYSLPAFVYARPQQRNFSESIKRNYLPTIILTYLKTIPRDSTHSHLSNEYLQDPTNPIFFLTQLSQLSPIISPTINPIDLKIIPRDSTHSQLSNEYMQYPTSQNFIFRYFSPNESKPRTYKSPCKSTINCPMPPPGLRWSTSTSPMRRAGV